MLGQKGGNMALTGKTTAEQIYHFLSGRGLTDNAAFGLMGNLQAESGLNPWNLQNSYERSLGYNDKTYTQAVDDGSYANFASDRAGYGLAQWTSQGRKQGLLAHAKMTARSIGDLEMQLEWLMTELEGAYKGVLFAIQDAKTIREASDVVLTRYEIPADQSESMKRLRASYGESLQKQVKGDASESLAGTPTSSPRITGADSSLVSVVDLTPKNYGTRTAKIVGITPHHMAGNMTVESCMKYHRTANVSASANYYIGSDGRIGQAVPEAKGAWTSSNKANDMSHVTIEVANCSLAPDWKISDAAYAALVALCADICARNGIPKLEYTGKAGASLTVHKMFAATACPGPYLMSLIQSGKFAADVNARIGSAASGSGGAAKTQQDGTEAAPKGSGASDVPYRVRVKIPDLNIRAGAGTGYAVCGKCPPGVYTIVEEREGMGSSKGWGKLKSGAGWISLGYAEKV